MKGRRFTTEVKIRILWEADRGKNIQDHLLRWKFLGSEQKGQNRGANRSAVQNAMKKPDDTKDSDQSGSELFEHHMCWEEEVERGRPVSTAAAGSQIAGEHPRVGYRGLLNEFPVGGVVQVDGIEAEKSGIFCDGVATQFRQRQSQSLTFGQRGFHKSKGSKGTTRPLALKKQVQPKFRPVIKTPSTSGSFALTDATSRSIYWSPSLNSLKRVQIPVLFLWPCHHSQLAQHFLSDFFSTFSIVTDYTTPAPVLRDENAVLRKYLH